MNVMRSAITATGTGLSAVAFLTMVLACASQGDIASESGTAMTAVADTGTEAVAEAEDPSRKLICRRIKPTGSRFGERVCMRQAQWEKYAGRGRRDLETMQRTDTNPGNNPDGG
jgi:hypothetical protein